MSGYIGPSPVPQATQTREAFTATSGQTTFNTGGYTAGFIDVYLNGVKLAAADYTATNGSDVVLAVGAAADDILETVAYSAFTVADQDFTGDLTVDGDTFVVDSTNNRVGIGTTSPSGKLDILTGTTGNVLIDAEGGSNFHAKVVNDAGDLHLGSRSTSADTYLTSQRGTIFNTGSSETEAMRIESSGNLLVGKSADNLTDAGQVFTTAGSSFTRSGGAACQFNRNTSDGEIVRLSKDGTTTGSIGTWSGTTFIGTGDTGIAFAAGGDDIRPFNPSSVAQRDAAISIGESGNRFKDLYLSGGVYLGGTGSANKLDDYEEGTWTPADATSDSLTFTVNQANYTKVGRIVTIAAYISFPTNSGTQNVRISGLPYTNISQWSPALLTTSTSSLTKTHYIRVRTGEAVLDVGSAEGDAALTNSDLSNAWIIFSVTYMATT